MTEKELATIIIDEIKEYKLEKYRNENHKQYSEITEELNRLSDRMAAVRKKLTAEEIEILEQYTIKNAELADYDCNILYLQGARDGIKIMKKLGVI